MDPADCRRRRKRRIQIFYVCGIPFLEHEFKALMTLIREVKRGCTEPSIIANFIKSVCREREECYERFMAALVALTNLSSRNIDMILERLFS